MRKRKKGVEEAPKFLREAGVIQRLEALGYKVKDYGDVAVEGNPDLIVDKAIESDVVGKTTKNIRDAVAAAVSSGRLTVNLGGDHSSAIGTVTGHAAATHSDVALIWIDAHADMNTVRSSGSDVQLEHAVPVEKRHDYLEFALRDCGIYEDVLKRKTPVGGAVRRAIVNQLFQACFKIVWYPSRQLYRVAAERLVSKYPHLSDKIGSGSGLDCGHLVVYGETAETLQKHNEWLHENVACEDEDQMRPRLLATAEERHQRLRTLTLSEALMFYPFLGTETSLLTEFDVLFKAKGVESIENGCRVLCSLVLQSGEESEVVEFSKVASEDGVLAILQFVASRCKEPLNAVLTENEIPLTPCLVEQDGAVSLWIDGQLFFPVSSLLSGVACLFAAYWVFHIEYAKKAHKMLTFIEHAFLGLCYTKPRVKALELINFYRANATCVAQSA
ncbi:uncharacterized protein ISCGN_030019 [Ixodes scapularis]